MSAQEHLNPDQFPMYEVGEPEHDQYVPDPPASRYVMTPYSSKDKVDPEQFGLQRGGPIGEYSTKGAFSHSEHVPVESLRAVQPYVYEGHVRNLSTVPAAVLERTHAWDPPSVVRSREGLHLLTEGTHRAAAAIHRGDKTLRVRIEGAEQ